MSNFRRIVVHDVWVVRMECGIVLVVGLGWIEGLQWNYLGHDRALEDLGFVELCDIRLGDPLLLVTAIENGRTILGALVRDPAGSTAWGRGPPRRRHEAVGRK